MRRLQAWPHAAVTCSLLQVVEGLDKDDGAASKAMQTYVFCPTSRLESVHEAALMRGRVHPLPVASHSIQGSREYMYWTNLAC